MSCRLKQRQSVQAVRIKDGYQPRDAYKPFGGAKHVRFTLERAGEQPRTRVLLIRDSFSNALLPYLFNSFDEITVVPRLKLTFQPRLLDQYPADLVIYEFVERALLWPVYAGKTGTPAETKREKALP